MTAKPPVLNWNTILPLTAAPDNKVNVGLSAKVQRVPGGTSRTKS